MTEPFFVDTNVLIYADDAADPRKQAIARDLLRTALTGRSAWLSTQVLEEFFVVAMRRLQMPAAEARRRVEIYSALDVFRPAIEDVLAAIDLHRLHQLSFWDALVVRAALASGCRSLLTEDLQAGRAFDGLRVVDPFREGATGE